MTYLFWKYPIHFAADRISSVMRKYRTNPNAVSGNHLAPFAVKNVSPAAAANPLEARMR